MARWNMPVEPDELLYALKVGNAAALNQMPLAHTPGEGLEIVDEETGQVQTVHFADNAVNRFGVAIAREFDNLGSKFFSLMTRIGALMRLLEDERARPYVQLEGEFTKIRNAMIETMASFPITPEGFLDADQFFNQLDTIGEKRFD
ncbi:hypothetical protein [Desulfosarcina ovata]|uniref:Uncharacterized protein n=2 Tax=Desulfosarcina ovata TaxID=83564 RepID=A0A5K8AIC2_9BACT|nr:hypothetical protein [Desulfosarcina ovata]BBO82620.1 hypothetical protein DSCO28_31860 [Desulfosarcina ovata subsp. sediminis]BBO92411.1 hypothetical protein DSCOOX_55910 [Desulfosarcina ovata subsp. ovata]